MNEPKKTPIQNPLTVLRVEFDDWALLFDPDRAMTMGINPTGVAVWKLIDGQKGIEDIVKEIKEKLSDVSISAEKEISDFIDELYKNGFIGYSLNGETE
jgi:SynChlorMet cassette protein ScmD